MWGKENLHAIIEHEGNSLNVNLFSAISKNHVYGSFFFEGNATRDVYLQMLQNTPMNKLITNGHEDFIFNRTVLRLTVRSYLNDNLSRRWIERAGGE